MIYNKKFKGKDDFLTSVIEGAPYGIISIDRKGYITISNSLAVDFLGLKIMTDNSQELPILESIDQLTELHEQIRKGIKNGFKDFDLEEIGYRNKYLTIRGRGIKNGIMITIADITSVKDAEHSALNLMLEGQELERKRLAREIHDGIGPILSAVKMNLANIEDEVENLNHSLGDKFRKSYKMIDEAANDLRSISHNLLPKVLSDFGLVEALETLCEKVDTLKNVEVTFMNSGLVKRLDEIIELGLYRISQELINNSLKHAKAKKITLQLIKREKNLQLMYEDNGLGFNIKSVNQGIGLMNIENRAKALSGDLIIDSYPEKGMTATLEIPIDID
jgi:signal transduction histidine kinase